MLKLNKFSFKKKQIIAFVYSQWYKLFDLRQKFIWFEQIFIRLKDILFESCVFHLIQINHFIESNKVLTNNLLRRNIIFFLSVTYILWQMVYLKSPEHRSLFLIEICILFHAQLQIYGFFKKFLIACIFFYNYW